MSARSGLPGPGREPSSGSSHRMPIPPRRAAARAVLVLAALLSVTAAFAQDPPTIPSPVVERWLTTDGTVTRMSLFDNRVAVVSIRYPGQEEPAVRRLTLDPGEYEVYATAIERQARAVAEAQRHERREVPRSDGGQGRILVPLDATTVEVRYSTMEVLDLPRSRLVSAVDDLERRVLESLPGEESLRGWTPEKDELVELLDGRIARIDEVWKDGTIVLEDVHSLVRETVVPDLRTRVIAKPLGKKAP